MESPVPEPVTVRAFARPSGIYLSLEDLKKLARCEQFVCEAAAVLKIANDDGDSHAYGLSMFLAYFLGVASAQVERMPPAGPATFAALTRKPEPSKGSQP